MVCAKQVLNKPRHVQAEVFEEIATMEFPFEGIPTIPPRKDMDHMVVRNVLNLKAPNVVSAAVLLKLASASSCIHYDVWVMLCNDCKLCIVWVCSATGN